jgi:hypothetical protein
LYLKFNEWTCLAIALSLAESAAEQQQNVAPVVQTPLARIDEDVLKRCIDLLELCDPTGETPDDPGILFKTFSIYIFSLQSWSIMSK